MSDTIIDGTSVIDWDQQTSYGPMKVNERGGKSLQIFGVKKGTCLRLKTPLMFTWGASTFTDASGISDDKFSMSLQFPSGNFATEECTAFLANLVELESKIKEDIFLNAKDWAGKTYKSRDIVDEIFNSILKYPKISKGSSEPDLSKMPTFRVKIPQWENAWKCEIYDEDGEDLFVPNRTPDASPIDYLQPKTHVACIIQCGGLWYANGKYSVTWKLLQGLVKGSRNLTTGTCFIKLDGAQREHLDNVVNDDNDEGGATGVLNTVVEDSDGEGDDNNQDVPPVAPVLTKPASRVPSSNARKGKNK